VCVVCVVIIKTDIISRLYKCPVRLLRCAIQIYIRDKLDLKGSNDEVWHSNRWVCGLSSSSRIVNNSKTQYFKTESVSFF
jgi:hypothetical protein